VNKTRQARRKKPPPKASNHQSIFTLRRMSHGSFFKYVVAKQTLHLLFAQMGT
jgi:hypothetical protein